MSGIRLAWLDAGGLEHGCAVDELDGMHGKYNKYIGVDGDGEWTSDVGDAIWGSGCTGGGDGWKWEGKSGECSGEDDGTGVSGDWGRCCRVLVRLREDEGYGGKEYV